MSLEASAGGYPAPTEGAIDYALVEKAAKNGARLAISQYECAPGGAIHDLLRDMLIAAIPSIVAGVASLLSSPNDLSPNVHTVYAQQKQIVKTAITELNTEPRA